jgi:putative acetyltransferase
MILDRLFCAELSSNSLSHRSARKAYQGQGVGTALLAALLDLADNWLGLRRLELQVYTDNAAAVRLYETFGFLIEGTARQLALRGGVYVDAYSMARLRP